MTFAAVPFGNKGFVIIHNGFQVEFKKTLDEAKLYIEKNHKTPRRTRKPTSKAKLPSE
jgi:hypothetical protein